MDQSAEGRRVYAGGGLPDAAVAGPGAARDRTGAAATTHLPEAGAPSPPAVVVVGAASRDIAMDDPRGWRLGGGVAYGTLALARLGVRTGCVIGVDPAAAEAHELDLLRAAGAAVVPVLLDRVAIFDNVETPAGRVQTCHSVSDPVTPDAVPPAWRSARIWFLAPVADEIPDEWAAALPIDAMVVLGWQGLLRELHPGQRVRRRRPRRSAIVSRADLVGLSIDDVSRDLPMGELLDLLRPRVRLAMTHGASGGCLVIGGAPAGRHRILRYPVVRADAPVDPTGAGDTFVAGLIAARASAAAGGDPDRSAGLCLAAVAASLVVEGVGLAGVPEQAAVRQRIAEISQRVARGT